MTSPPDGCRANKLRIGFGMLNSVDIPEYAQHCAQINQEYCRRHGYDFIIERCPGGSKYPRWQWADDDQYLLVWHKAAFLRRHLPRYHYFVYLDSDAYVYDHEISLESFTQPIIEAKPETSLIVQRDCHAQGNCYRGGELNAGILILRNNKKAFDLLDDWDASWQREDGRCVDMRHQHPREQECLIRLSKRDDYRAHVHMVPVEENMIGQLQARYIRHLSGLDGEKRNQILKAHAREVLQLRMGWIPSKGLLSSVSLSSSIVSLMLFLLLLYRVRMS